VLEVCFITIAFGDDARRKYIDMHSLLSQEAARV
jgi:hypothetical protein